VQRKMGGKWGLGGKRVYLMHGIYTSSEQAPLPNGKKWCPLSRRSAIASVRPRSVVVSTDAKTVMQGRIKEMSSQVLIVSVVLGL